MLIHARFPSKCHETHQDIARGELCLWLNHKVFSQHSKTFKNYRT